MRRWSPSSPTTSTRGRSPCSGLLAFLLPWYRWASSASASVLLHFLLEHVNWVYVYKEHRPWGSKLNTIMVEFLEFGEFLLILGHLVTGIILRQTNQHPIDIRPLSLNISIAVLLLCHIFFLPKNFLVRLVSCFYCKNQ